MVDQPLHKIQGNMFAKHIVPIANMSTMEADTSNNETHSKYGFPHTKHMGKGPVLLRPLTFQSYFRYGTPTSFFIFCNHVLALHQQVSQL